MSRSSRTIAPLLSSCSNSTQLSCLLVLRPKFYTSNICRQVEYMHKRWGSCVPGKCEEGGLEALMNERPGHVGRWPITPSPHTRTHPAWQYHSISFFILYCFDFNKIGGVFMGNMGNCIISPTPYLCHLFLYQLHLWTLCFPTLCSLIYLKERDHACQQQNWQFHLYLNVWCSGRQFDPIIKKHFLNNIL
jgi:hypothetical protein